MRNLVYTNTFDSAHRLLDYEGKCRHLHGHTYRATITVYSKELSDDKFLVDYADLKAALDHYDHATLAWEMDAPLIRFCESQGSRLVVMPSQTTVENISEAICLRVAAGLPDHVKGFVSVDVSETPKGSCRFTKVL